MYNLLCVNVFTAAHPGFDSLSTVVAHGKVQETATTGKESHACNSWYCLTVLSSSPFLFV